MVAAVLLSVLAMPLQAHHSWGAEFDVTKPVTLTGVLTKFEWTNPHSFLYLDVKGERGKVVSWRLEGYPPGVLYRTGWRRDAIKIGDTVTVTGFRSRSGIYFAHGRQVTLVNGARLFFGPPPGTGEGSSPVVDVK